MSKRYGVRWVTETRTDQTPGGLIVCGWDVVDWTRFDNIAVQRFGVSEEVQAHGLCKLLNSIEEENDGV